MSTTHDLPVEPAETAPMPQPSPDAGEHGTGTRGLLRRPRALVAATVAVGVLAGGTAAWFGLRHTTPSPTTPISLPDTMANLPALAADPLHGASWQQKAAQAAAGTAWAARTYGHAGAARTIRVVVARADLTGKLEQAWAVGEGDGVGSARCTHNTRLTPSGAAHNRPTLLVCWRSSPGLSAYTVTIDPKATTPVANADGAAALDTAWRAAGGSD